MAPNKRRRDGLNKQMEQSCRLEDDIDITGQATGIDSSRVKPASRGKQSRSNNNEEDYEDNYVSEDPQDSGRISGGSRESAFSSAASDGEETVSNHSESCGDASLTSSSSDHHSSGRSSADDVKILNPHSNLVPELPECLALVETVRVRFLDTLGGHEELYEQSDLEHMKTSLPVSNFEQSLAFRLISRYIHFQNKLDAKEKLSERELEEAVEKLRELLRFRHAYRIPTTRSDQFSREFYMLSGIFQFGVDKRQVPVLYLRARIHRRWSQKLDEHFRRYVAWQVDQITKSYAGAKVDKTVNPNGIEKDGSFAICFDCLHVSYSCLDMDFLRYLVRVMVQYYPTYCRYALCVDLPWLFRSVWKLVQSWLPEDARNTVQLITAKQLTEYIDEDQIPNSMRINDLKASEKPIECKHQLLEDMSCLKGIDEFAEELGLSPNELKQFEAHVEKIRKEYEQLGAI